MSTIIGGHEVAAEIRRGRKSSVYRARRTQDGESVVLKVLRAEHARPDERRRFAREYEILRSLDGPGIVKAHALDRDGPAPVLVLEDFGGEALDHVLLNGPLEIVEFLRIAVRLTDCLRQAHERGIMHKDVNPSNVIWNERTGVVKLVDFGIATNVPRETVAVLSPNLLEGTLAYVSPEQTGRLNRSVDYRTDLYSLGVTLFELLTGRLPFDASDAMEVVHSHIARTPASPGSLREGVPSAVSDIILRLLAKMPEARYQSAAGVHADLEKCLRDVEARGTVEPFEIATYDVPARFQIPQKLYGRNDAIRRLLNAMERVSAGANELVLVSGYSGIGKSSLVHELYGPVAARNGYFASGKFEYFERTVPYAAVIRALQGLVRQILSESEQRIATWRQKLLPALGPNGRLVIDVIPELALILGPQPPVQKLPETEAQQRFTLVFHNFVRAFATQPEPLILFIDDLQWADAQSLKFVERLMIDPETRYLLLVGAYRDNEVDASHPLLVTLGQIGKSATATVDRVELSPLAFEHVHELVTDALRCSPTESLGLAQLCFAKTHGNSFFLTQFLSMLWQKGLLVFDARLRRWTWDATHVQDTQVTDNVVEFLLAKLNELSAGAREELELAACIGNEFDLKTLAVLGGRPEEEAATRLQTALVEGLIVPVDDLYRYAAAHEGEEAGSHPPRYRFLHDRVREAATALMSEAERTRTHLQIGRFLLSGASEQKLEETIFEIVNHMNAGAALLEDGAQRLELARLNLHAGRKARRASAFQSAVDYLERGVELATSDVWNRDCELARDLLLHYADVLGICGRLDESRRRFAEVIEQSRTAFEKLVAYEKLAEALSSAGKQRETFSCAREALALHGISFPDDLAKLRPETERRLKPLLARESVARLAAAELGSEIDALIGRLYDRLVIAAYVSAQEYLPAVICSNIEYTLAHGLVPQSGTAAVWMALLAWKYDPDLCIAYGELSLTIMDRFDDPYYRARTLTMAYLQVLGWKHSFRKSETVFADAFMQCHNSGDLQYASFALLGKYISTLAQGESCAHALEDCIKWRDYCERYVPFELGQAQIRVHLLRRLMALPSELDVEAILEAYAREKNVTDVCESLVELVRISALLGEYEAGVRYAERAEPLLEAGAGGTLILRMMFWQSYAICCARLYASADEEARRALKMKWSVSFARLHAWAEVNPENFTAYCSFVEAEAARARGDSDTAVAKYVKTMAHAERHDQVLLQAMANEALGDLYWSDGYRFAAAHLREAVYLYRTCGATAKANLLVQTYARLFALDEPLNAGSTAIVATGTTGTHVLDWKTFAKTSQALSGEILFPELIQRLLRIMMENAGAQRGVLVLAQDGQWWVRAEGWIERPDVKTFEDLTLDAMENGIPQAFAVSIVRSVLRTKEAVVLPDATRDPRFRGDPYVRQQNPKSVLCLPIVRFGQCLGSVYLENNLTTDAFTPARIEVLSILSAQAAISMEIARLYEESQLQLRKEQQLTEQLRRANRLKSEFLATVSHELRSPLNVIINAPKALLQDGYAERDVWRCKACRTDYGSEDTLEPGAPPPVCPTCSGALTHSKRIVFTGNPLEHRDMLRALEASASHLALVVDELLDSAKLEAGRMTIRFSLVELGVVLEEVRSALSAPISGRRLTVHYPAFDAPLAFDADPTRLKQILMNLISNAIKFTPDGGQIDIEAEEQEDKVLIRVKDTGIGIPPNMLDAIFESFRQVDGGHTRAHGGVGLGLWISKQLVELHSGRIWAESELGKGSCFSILLPLRQKTPIAPESHPA